MPMPPVPWLDESIADAGLDEAEVHAFLEDKRSETEPTCDAGLNPKPDGGAPTSCSAVLAEGLRGDVPRTGERDGR